MSWRASGYVKELQECPNGEMISCHEKCVAFVLADSHQDKTGLYTYPSLETIARDARVDVRTCRRLLAALAAKGVIARNYPKHQGRGLLTFYSFPELDSQKAEAAANVKKGGHSARLFFAQRGAKGGQKGDKIDPHTVGITGTVTEEQKLIPHIPLAGARGSEGATPLAPGLFDSQLPAEPGAAVCLAIDQTMCGCSWTKKSLRKVLQEVISLECDKGVLPATTALAIMAAWKFQTDNSHMLRGKFGPAKFLEFGIWKDANLLLWDHERMDRGGRL